MKRTPQTHFASLVQEFFLDRLIRQRNSSPQTVAAYRDCFRLLFEFAREYRNKPTDHLVLADLDAPLVLAFLDYLERVRKNSIRSRNARLAAIRSFLRFAVLQDPQSLGDHPTHARHSDEASQQAPSRIPVARRGTSDNQGSRSFHMGRATRPRSSGHTLQHGCSRV